ncbi:MAG: hypothetical protein ACD_75C01511G0002 [uncultured bacterium]|nr:MAG: hypothetical protein ACD_75C01511G0002 [uncultured bacterium]
MMDRRIGIAMSGGVDSTACALLLRERYDIQGFFMRLAQPNFESQKARVENIAARLGIPLQVIDLRQAFEQHVLDYFSASYFGGLTPNPCVICNREIKFGLFLKTILDCGMTHMATGHYARLEKIGETYRLFKGIDPSKDQSYFLSRLSQDQLAKIVFPLGGQTKESTYQFVEERGFTDFRGLESQDVCFLGDTTVGSFLETRLTGPSEEGPILSTTGKRLGTHHGLFRYTIGQRKGLGIASDAPLYVTELDVERNAVIVGGNDELFKQNIQVADFHWLAGAPPEQTKEYTVRIRYSHKGSAARLVLKNGGGEIVFSEPQRAITPGQFAVVYEQDELLGSGIILAGGESGR